MLSKFNIDNFAFIKAMIDLLYYIAKFCDNMKTEKLVQENNSEIIDAIYYIIHLLKNNRPISKSSKIVASSRERKKRLSIEILLLAPLLQNRNPPYSKKNKVVVKIKNQSSSNSLRQTK